LTYNKIVQNGLPRFRDNFSKTGNRGTFDGNRGTFGGNRGTLPFGKVPIFGVTARSVEGAKIP